MIRLRRTFNDLAREAKLGLASNVTPLHVLVCEPGAIDRLRAASRGRRQKSDVDPNKVANQVATRAINRVGPTR